MTLKQTLKPIQLISLLQIVNGFRCSSIDKIEKSDEMHHIEIFLLFFYMTNNEKLNKNPVEITIIDIPNSSIDSHLY
jgi:hypothetical protein